MAEKEARFRFVKYEITRSLIEIKDSSNLDGEMQVQIDRAGALHESELKFRLAFNVMVKDVNNSLLIEVGIFGYFEFDQDISEQEKDIFFNSSAPSILFPYVRSYITALTSLSGIKSVILPTLNLTSRSDKQSK